MNVSVSSFALLLTGFLSVFSITDVSATETVIYSEGFENNNGTFTHSGVLDNWEWGTPAANFTPGPRAAHSGNKCWGTDLDDYIPYDENSYLVSPAIVLPALGANQVMRVRFFGWIAVDYMADRGQFQISSNGYDWETKTELLHTMQGGWNEYVFDISSYAGDTIHLRFRCTTDNQDNFDPPSVPYNMAGLYVDDIAITVVDAPGIKKIITFEGSENQSSIASCPWLLVKDGMTGKNSFKQENDIYSTARGAGAEYTDFYQLNTFLEANENGKYILKLKETDREISYTDVFKLYVVDHDASVDISCDENGNVFTYKSKNDGVAATSAIDKNGKNVAVLVNTADEIGYKAYNGDYVDLDFSSIGNVQHPILLFRAHGFMVDTLEGKPTGVAPRIYIQTQNASGKWVTRNTYYPRWKSAFCGYDMNGFFSYAKKIRILSASCNAGKYHLIDWATISTSGQKSVTTTELSPLSAVRSDGIDVTTSLSSIDGKYAKLTANEEITFKFDAPGKDNVKKRDFIIKTKGYYIPGGTYFFYTWNGNSWAQRDGWTIPDNGDQTRNFDFSLWLPDPSGQNRIRIWQDFIFDPASIDYVGLKRDSISLIMNSAIDLRDTSSILNLVNVSDNIRHEWDWGADWPLRNRWVEIGWADSFVNTPPSTNPVFVTNTGSTSPTINWTYGDIDGNPQKRYEVEVWTGADGTGYNIWDPQTWQGAASSVTYAGPPLVQGQQYFARVKAFDSLSWGNWSESPFTISINHPPVADAGHDTMVIAVPTCLTSVVLNGTGSHDPDGDTLSYLWTGPFGTAAGANIAVYLNPDTALIYLIVSDGKGGSGMDSVTIIVHDTIAPVPNAASLAPLSGECNVTITTPPTATDNCEGLIVGRTDSLVFTTPGTRDIIWRFTDACENVAIQSQTIIVADNTPPVPDLQVLPALSSECFIDVTSFPTATDNCAGSIVGTTQNPLYYSQVGTYTITWQYTDGSGNSVMQPQQVIVTDNVAPVPNIAQLPVLQANCALTVSSYPTANDNCKGTVTGTTTDPLSYSKAGTYTIHWQYNDGNGNTATQQQTAIVIDNTAPVPSVSQLPVINGIISGTNCYTVRTYPTAMDNCKGRIVGTTQSPLVYCNRGVFTIVWQYSDGNGNMTNQNQTVNIR